MADDGSKQSTTWPRPKFTFTIDLGDGKPLPFAEVSGLERDDDPIDYRHGDGTFAPISMPGMVKFGNVTLRRGIAPSDSILLTWSSEVMSGATKRRTVTISLLDETSTPTMAWTLANAFPTKITGIDLTSDGDGHAVETLDIAYETLAVKAP